MFELTRGVSSRYQGKARRIYITLFENSFADIEPISFKENTLSLRREYSIIQTGGGGVFILLKWVGIVTTRCYVSLYNSTLCRFCSDRVVPVVYVEYMEQVCSIDKTRIFI